MVFRTNRLEKVSTLPDECIPFEECRAKTCLDGTYGTFVFDHCRYAGYVAEGLLQLLPTSLKSLFPSTIPFFVSLHDIGKVSPGFVRKYFLNLLESIAPEWVTLSKDYVNTHASIGAKALAKLFNLREENPIVSAIATHHGWRTERLAFTNDGVWQKEREALVKKLAEEFDIKESLESVCKATIDVTLLAGITCVSDWIASDEVFFPPEEVPLSSDEGRQRAIEALRKCGFKRVEIKEHLSFSDVFGVNPYPAQSTFIEKISAPGVYILEAPMGMGKTEAALYVAYKFISSGVHSGLYFALPTRLTSDKIHERVERFLNKISATPIAVKLAHGQAWLKEFEFGRDGDGEEDGGTPLKDAFRRPPSWFNPSKRGLLFPFAVGTIDQALLSVLNVKHAFVRSYALAGKVVILDEVHSYDMYTGTLLDELVRRLRQLGCTVIILSATLTTTRRNILLQEKIQSNCYPFLSGLQMDGKSVVQELGVTSSRKINLRWIDASEESPLVQAVEKARAGCNALCIANTVATAQEWMKELKSLITENEFPIGLLHAKFTNADRARIEKEWLEKLGKLNEGNENIRPKGSILVATQIVEQSVDIDADWMLSELAPIDMILQRIGRLWRHQRTTRPIESPTIALVCNKIPKSDYSDIPVVDEKGLLDFFGKGCWVYAPYVLLRTYEVLQQCKTLSIPSEIRALLEAVYSEEIPNTELHHILHAAMSEKAQILQSAARMNQSNALPMGSDNDAKTRYGERPSIALLILRSLEMVNEGMYKATLLNGQLLTISQFSRDFSVTRDLYQCLVYVSIDKYLRLDNVLTRKILSQHFFASDMPLICIWNEANGRLREFNTGQDLCYCYHPLYGAILMKEDKSMPQTFSLDEYDGEFYFDDDNDW